MRKSHPYNFVSIIGGLYLALSFLSPLLWSEAFSQTTYGSEAELKKQAAKFFESEDFVAAAPLYSQLLSLYPKEVTYNYRAGVCFLFVDKDKTKALSYLEEAVKMKGCPDDIFYFLGICYHLNYQFDEAINAFQQFEKVANSGGANRNFDIPINNKTYSLQQYKKTATKQDIKKYAIERQIEMCKNAKQLTSVKHIIDTLERHGVAIDAYYSVYDLNKFGGKILATPDMYKTSVDKKKGENKTLFLSRENHSVYFSSYGNDEKNGKNIFKLFNYSDEAKIAPNDLGLVINTTDDEDYPFITPDGKTLYFSSKGHNSMGGYDVFKSVWDESTRAWTEPENLGTPINSPYDDFFFTAGTEDNEAYFSTTRESDFGKLQVYKIKLREKPLDYVTIAGEIKSQDVKNTKISVINSENKLVAVVTPNPENGKYSMSLPPNQSYKLVVEKEGFLPHAENITIPNQVKSSPIKQEIVMDKNSTGEEMVVSNSFKTDTSSAAPENKQELKSEFKYEDKDKLQPVDINGTTVMVTPPTNKVEESPVTIQGQGTKDEGRVADTQHPTPNTELPTQNSEPKTPNSQPLSKNISNSDIINNAEQEARTLNTEAKKMKKDAQTALSDATQMQSLAKAKEQSAKDILANAESIKDNAEKQKETERGNKLQDDAQVKIKEAELAIFKAKQMEEQADKKQQEVDLAFANVRELEKSSGIKVTSDKGAGDESNKPTSPAELAKQYKEDAQKAFATSQNLKAESAELLKQAEGLKEEAKIQNEPEKENTLQRAYNIEALAKERENSAEKELSKAQQLQDSVKQLTGESIQLAANVPSIFENSSSATNGKLTPEHVQQIELAFAEAKQLRYESDSLNHKATQAAEDAKTLKRAAAKKKIEEEKALTQQAVEKSNEANKKLFYANQLEDSLNKQDNVTTITKNTTNDNNTVSSQNPSREIAATDSVSLNNPQSSIPNPQSAINPEVSANTQGQQSIVNDSINSEKSGLRSAQQSIIVPPFVSAEHKKEIENSFAEATQLQIESDSLSNRALEVFKEANQLKRAKMKEKKAEGQVLINLSLEKKTKADAQLVYATQLKDSLITQDSVETQNIVSLQKPSVNETQVQNNNPAVTQENQPTQNNLPLTAENPTPQNNLPATTTTETQTEQKPVVKTGKQPAKKNIPATAEKQVEQKPAEKTLAEIQSMTAEEKKKELETATAQSSQLATESESLARESQDVFQKARRMANPAEKNVMMKKSTELNNQSIKKQKESENKSAYAKKIKSVIASQEIPVVAANQQRNEGNQQLTPTTSEQPTSVEVATTQQLEETPKFEKDENLDKNHPNYPKYIVLLEEVKQKENEEKQMKESAAALESEAKQNTEDAKNYKEQAHITDKKKDKQHLLAMGQEAERKAKEKQTTAEESNAKAEELSKTAKEKNEEAIALKKTLIETKASGITASENNTTIPTTPETTTKITNENLIGNTQDTINNQQSTINSEKSELHSIQQSTITNPQSTTTNPQTANTYNIEQLVVIPSNATVSVYSPSNPIPVNLAMPEGLYFKIQIGAFRNPIPQDLFKGMQPVTGETTNNGLTRYTAGMFRAFQPADWAKNEIRQIGYSDAFVVAYYNGKRISMAEARTILRNTSPQQKQQYVATEKEEMKTLKKYNIYPEKYPKQINNPAIVAFKKAVQAKGTEAQATVIIPETTTATVTTTPEATPATDEFYYTVQVGAYRHPEFPTTLKDVQSITKEQVANDLYRYTSGKYNNFTDANAAKNILVTKVKDAFVIAFYKGKKITALKEAQRIENTIKNQIPQKNKEKTQVPVEQKQTSEKQNVPIPKVENTTTEIIFKVQIGAFREKVPVEIFNKFLKIRTQGISNKINAEGLNVFYAGTVKDYQAADALKTEISTTAELPDAFIVAFKGDKQIPIDEALKITEKK